MLNRRRGRKAVATDEKRGAMNRAPCREDGGSLGSAAKGLGEAHPEFTAVVAAYGAGKRVAEGA